MNPNPITHQTIMVEMTDPITVMRKAVDQLEAMGEGQLMSSDEVLKVLAHLAAARDLMGFAYDGLLKQMQAQDPTLQGVQGEWLGDKPPMEGFIRSVRKPRGVEPEEN